MTPTTVEPPAGAAKVLIDWLAAHHVEHEVHPHPIAYTAQATAIADGVHPRTFAKTVAVATADARHALLVVDAVDRVDLHKARRCLAASDVRIVPEREYAALVPAFEVGAAPPIGELIGMPVIADFAVRDDPMISFAAGSHRHSVRVDRVAWERAAGVTYADLAVDSDEPAWAR